MREQSGHSQSQQVLAIDLVRFLCALLVVAHHYGAMLPLAPPPYAAGLPVSAAAAPWTWAGWVGVELFFVVSGYVIAMSAGRGSAADFLKRRVLRLAPAAWIAATLTTAVALSAAIAPPGELLARWSASVAFMPFAEQVDVSYWTLGVELSFYLLVAALVATPPGKRAIEPLGLVLALASLSYWIARGGWSARASESLFADLSLLPHGAFFAIGIALRSVALHGRSPLRMATLVAGLVAAMFEIGAQARFMAGGLGLAAGPALPLALFGAGVAVVACAGRLQPWLAVLGARRLAFMGAVTYPLYLIHQRAGMIAIAALCGTGLSGGAAVALVTLTMLVVAEAIAAWAEPALRRWLAARFDAFSPRHVPGSDIPPSASLPIG